MVLLVLQIASGSLAELPRDVTDGSPVLSVLLVLTTHLDKETSGQNFLVELLLDEINGVDLGLKDDLKGTWIVLLDLDKLVVREGLFDIFFDSVEVALDEVERHVLNVIVKALYFINQVLSLRHRELLLLLLSTHLNNQI